MIEGASTAGVPVENSASMLRAARNSGAGDLVAARECEDNMAGFVVGRGVQIARVNQWRGGGYKRQGRIELGRSTRDSVGPAGHDPLVHRPRTWR